MSRASIESSTPSSRDSIWNGKPAPSTYLHKQLDVTGTSRQVDKVQGLGDHLGPAFFRGRAQVGQSAGDADQSGIGIFKRKAERCGDKELTVFVLKADFHLVSRSQFQRRKNVVEVRQAGNRALEHAASTDTVFEFRVMTVLHRNVVRLDLHKEKVALVVESCGIAVQLDGGIRWLYLHEHGIDGGLPHEQKGQQHQGRDTEPFVLRMV